MYLDGDIFQSASTQSGESQFPYVKMMEHFLPPPADILGLGCGGGNLATVLARSAKSVTVVDHNAASIDIARQFFGMPQDMPCVVEDFRTFPASCNRQFGGIAVDVGGPGFCFEQQSDKETCRHIARVLAAGGRMIMNMLVTWLHQPRRAHRLPATKPKRGEPAAYCRALPRCFLDAERTAPASTT